MKTHLAKMKADLKILAEQIRIFKSQRKELKGYVPGLENAQYQYRSKHIARCLLRGRTLEQIEPKVRGSVNDYNHWRVRKEAARIVAEVLSATQPQTISAG